MNISYVHASRFGNGAAVAAEFRTRMAARGVAVDVHHFRELKPAELSPADLYVFSSPGRMGRPRGGMRRFLERVQLPAGTRYAVLTTEMAPPSGDDPAARQRVRPIMNEILQGKGLVRVADDAIHVTGLRGPLEDGWQEKVEAFAARLECGADQPPHPRMHASQLEGGDHPWSGTQTSTTRCAAPR